MIKKFLLAFIGFALVVAALVAVKANQIQTLSAVSHVPPPTAVTTVEAKTEVWRPVIRAIGTLAPVEGVTLSVDASGTVVKIAAENGSAVKAGDLLVELDTSVEVAQLAAAQSRAALAKISLDRAKELSDRNAMSKSDYDAADATHQQAVADVAAIQALIDKKTVRAPFDGRVGLRLVNLGQFVAQGAALLPLQKLDPIYVNFYVPQNQLAALSQGQKAAIAVDAYPDRVFPATITAINSEVDASTRNISAQATLANPQELLRAGMFARVELELPASGPAIVVPATAIAYASYGNSVFIVEKMKDPTDGHEYLGVRQQFVQLGATRGDLISITDGVKPGEQVVTAGVFKLRNGAPVSVNNDATPGANPTPKPANT
jgi:membrane fusion protein (multidrug efflux system)